MLLSLSYKTLEGGDVYRPNKNKLLNHCKEYWYIGSIVLKSRMQKYSKLALYATGLYDYLALSI